MLSPETCYEYILVAVERRPLWLVVDGLLTFYQSLRWCFSGGQVVRLVILVASPAIDVSVPHSLLTYYFS
jgi:hypothetical protein